MKTRFTLLLASIILMASCTSKVENGQDVIRLMKEKYNNTYLENFTFSQHVKEYENDSVTLKTIWHEAYSYPGNLIIKMDSFNSGSGYVFNQDTLYVLNNNHVDFKMENINDLVVLGFDVYPDPIEKTVKRLTKQGYDFSKVFETTVNNRPVYCVGASNENENTNRFYIDKENLYFIKYIKNTDHGISEVEFTDYEKVGDQLLATKVIFLNNGNLVMTEEYYDIKLPESIDSKIFDPNYFEEAIW